MPNQTVLLVLLIISGIAILGTLLWRAIYSTRHKGDEKALSVITKAQEASSWTVWWVFMCWGGTSFIFKEDALFTKDNIGTLLMFAVGLQCLAELHAAYFYTKMAKSEEPKCIEE